ncbi:metallophosphoesterase [Fictibacillus iocasae]|uniref:Metallophosphoesterase n=1 Tax=Fictibacillus iocasae TaxID=2715437 RepID=A0ABW2NMP9_9BACL
MLGMIAAAASAVLIGWMIYEAHSSRVIEKTIVLDTLPQTFDGKKIFFVSDIHRRKISSMFNEALKQSDWIFIGGDLLERGVPKKRVQENIRMLRQFGSVYFVFGNNDYDMRKEELLSLLEQEQVVVLENRTVKETIGGHSIYFAGVDDLAEGTPNLNAACIPSKEECTILMVHNPDFVNHMDQSQLSKLSLILSGHTHGGQIRIGPFGIRQKGGWYNVSGVPLLISNGYGATHLPLRLCAKSQSHLIMLKAKSLH